MNVIGCQQIMNEGFVLSGFYDYILDCSNLLVRSL